MEDGLHPRESANDKESLADVRFPGKEISLEEIVSWKSYSGLKDSKFGERPSENCVKIQKLSYMKFLEIACEVLPTL